MNTITIPRRFRGPPDSANGGYACGLIGKHLHGDARVRLHRPPPLDVALTIEQTSEHVTLLRNRDVIAEGTPAAVSEEVPEPVTFDGARAASKQYRWFTDHPFPGCFVCGPEREAGDGLRIFAGPVRERRVVAAPWIPDSSVCDTSSLAEPEVVWAVLDCPSWFALLEFEANVGYALLGQLSVRVLRRPAAGERCVVIGWPQARAERKLFSGAALYTSKGELLGHSDAVWIQLKEQPRATAQASGQGR